jgi:quercetin dioxygenase-like cupin family protein
MCVVKIDEVEEIPLGEASPIAGWTGGSVNRSRQPIIPDGGSKNYCCSVVNFSTGSTTGWHTHTCD